jgi:prepilin-type N-terminal cleavage/methylation domain-containing protein
MMKAEKVNDTAGERARRAEGERRTLGVPRFRKEHGTPYPEAFGVNLWNSSPAGFSILELLAVLVIISLLTGLTIGVAKYAHTKAAIARTRSEIAAMEMALEHYKNDNGGYPAAGANWLRATASGYPGVVEYSNSAVLYTALAVGPKRYFSFRGDQLRPVVVNGITTTNVIDPFGNPYNYYQTNIPQSVNATYFANNLATFDLWSYGPNGFNDEGTNDDITNWRR